MCCAVFYGWICQLKSKGQTFGAAGDFAGVCNKKNRKQKSVCSFTPRQQSKTRQDGTRDKINEKDETRHDGTDEIK